MSGDTNIDLRWVVMLTLGAVGSGIYGVLINKSKVDGKIVFHGSSFAFLLEATKLVLTVNFYAASSGMEEMKKHLSMLPWLDRLLMCTPALLYSFNNNLSIVMQTEMDPVTFQMLSNLKIVFTAVLTRIFLKREIVTNKLMALTLFFLAGVIHCVALDDPEKLERLSSTMFITTRGLVFVSVFSFCSALSSIIMEHVLQKHRAVPQAVVNMHLYGFGTLVNLLYYLSTRTGPLLQGYNGYTWLLLLSQVYCGLITSAILRHFGSLARVLIGSTGLLLSAFFSHVLLGVKVNSYFALCVVLVMTGFALYTGVVDSSRQMQTLLERLMVSRNVKTQVM